MVEFTKEIKSDGHLFPLSFVITGVLRGNNGIEGNREIGVVTDGRGQDVLLYLCFIYTPVFYSEFCFLGR